jgi:hypothetical protein
MSTQPTKPAHEIHYRRNEAGEFLFVRSVYTAVSGDVVRSGSGDFVDDVGAKAAEMCLLKLKLQIEGYETSESSGHFRVLTGDEARPFAQTIKTMFKGNSDGSGWHQAFFGTRHRFLFAQGSSNPVIIVKHDNTHRPHKILVRLVRGPEVYEQAEEFNAPEQVREILQSLERQIAAQRHRKGKAAQKQTEQTVEAAQADTTFASRRAERAWGALEHYVRDLANPDTPWNRLYGIDRLNDAVWRSAETYTYFGLQAREYMKANYDPQKNLWDITFSKPVLEAIQRAITVAKEYLPNHRKEGHSLTAFDDWCHPQAEKAGKPKFEIVRILIWPQERMVSEEAYAVARLHKIYNIPLFYLAPSAIENEPKDEYILFCKPKDSADTPPHDLRGMAWDSTRKNWQQVGELSYHPLEHFYALLKNPKLVFAIDAREMMIKKTWAAFEEAAL